MYNGKFSKDVKLNALSLTHKKNQVLKNMINAIDKFTDIDLQNNDFKKLLEARNRLKSYEEMDKIYKADFDIKIIMKMLYDQEIYVIKFREYSNNSNPEQPLTTGAISEKQTMGKKNLDKKKIIGELDKSNLDLTNKSFKSSTGERTKTNTSILKREKIVKSINEGKKLNFYNFINVIIISLLIIMLVIYVIILIYQNNMIETSHKIFLSLFFNYYQRDKFMNLLSVILSNAFKLLELLSNLPIGIISDQDFLDAIEKNADKFENSYHNYYISYVDLKTSQNEKLTSIYSNKNFTKIIGTFEPLVYASNFIQEVEHLGFLAKYNAINEKTNLDHIKEDYQILFNGSFLLNDTIPIKSSSIKTMYYVTKNFGSVFYIFFEELKTECEDEFNSYSNKTKNIYIILEILGFILYSCFFIINFIYLFRTSDLIFRNIFNIFIDFTQEGAYSFKNHYDNLIIVKKINEYRAVLIDFTMKNLENIMKKLILKMLWNIV